MDDLVGLVLCTHPSLQLQSILAHDYQITRIYSDEYSATDRPTEYLLVLTGITDDFLFRQIQDAGPCDAGRPGDCDHWIYHAAC